MPYEVITLSSDSEPEEASKKASDSSHSSRENAPPPPPPPPQQKPLQLASRRMGLALRNDMEYRSPLATGSNRRNQKDKDAKNNKNSSSSSSGSNRQRVNFDNILRKELIGENSSETASSSSYTNSCELSVPVENSNANPMPRTVGGWAFTRRLPPELPVRDVEAFYITPNIEIPPLHPPSSSKQPPQKKERTPKKNRPVKRTTLRDLMSGTSPTEIRRRMFKRRNRKRKTEEFRIVSSSEAEEAYSEEEKEDEDLPFRQSNIRTPSPCPSESDMQISGDVPTSNAFLPSMPASSIPAPPAAGSYPLPPPPLLPSQLMNNFLVPPALVMPPMHIPPPNYMPANFPSAFDVMRPKTRTPVKCPITTVVVRSKAVEPQRVASAANSESSRSSASSTWTRVSSPALSGKRSGSGSSADTEPPPKRGPRTPSPPELCDADTQTNDGSLQCQKCLQNDAVAQIGKPVEELPTSKPEELFLSSADSEDTRRANFDQWWNDVCKAKQAEMKRRSEYDILMKTAEKQTH